jgi:hypothetical protein
VSSNAAVGNRNDWCRPCARGTSRNRKSNSTTRQTVARQFVYYYYTTFIFEEQKLLAHIARSEEMAAADQ